MGERSTPAPLDDGMSDPVSVEGTAFDRRLTPARADLAAMHLKGRVSAPRYAFATPMRVTAPLAALHRAPSNGAPRETELLYGEPFSLYDQEAGWGWGQAGFDGYVGYVALDALSSEADSAGSPTHRVSVLRTYLYAQPDIKSPPLGLLSMNSLLRARPEDADARECGFLREGTGGYVTQQHVTPLGEEPADRVRGALLAGRLIATAESFLGTPYLWGGRSSLGLDCSALVQNVFAASGLAIPRDTDQQHRFWAQADHARILYEAPPDATYPQAKAWHAVPLQCGDLLYWAGHVAVMVSDRVMLHANATQMAVTRDEAYGFVSHVISEAGDIIAIFRPDYLTPDCR